jgi:hypothetical protein
MENNESKVDTDKMLTYLQVKQPVLVLVLRGFSFGAGRSLFDFSNSPSSLSREAKDEFGVNESATEESEVGVGGTIHLDLSYWD